jgi:hypothetical protein
MGNGVKAVQRSDAFGLPDEAAFGLKGAGVEF